jgi:ketosteroid isomerase-like protein
VPGSVADRGSTALVAIADHFNDTLRVSQREMVIVEGGNAALVLPGTHVVATMRRGESYHVERRR